VKKAYGGVVIDSMGRVLLREPTDHYKGHVWTFAKGKPEWGESPEQTALREVLEETGVRARIVAKVPGVFEGSTTSNEYFLMSPIEDSGQFDAETQRTTWANKEQARQLILLTAKLRRRRRDLRVLKLAFGLFDALQTSGSPLASSGTGAPAGQALNMPYPLESVPRE
jgi:8-oxo-dGTP diphosphatase